MLDLIKNLETHLLEGLNIVLKTKLKSNESPVYNVLIEGLGGSGIGGTIVAEWCKNSSAVPILINKDYSLPHWVSENTLVIACSYSGNTEETLEAALEAVAKGAQLAAVTSGGQLAEYCQSVGVSPLIIPGGEPPRGMLGYSLVCLLGILNHYGISTPNIQEEINQTVSLLQREEENIQKEAESLAVEMQSTTMCIYANEGMGGVATRWRQQLNENSKMVGWDATIPEMNHNELVGWAGGNDNISVVFLTSEGDHPRNLLRTQLNKELIKTYTPKVFEVKAKGNSQMARALYLIHLGDWLSYFLQQLHGVDILDIKVINALKGELAKKD